MTSLESFEKWARETLDSFPDENEQKAFDKARTEIELELAVKKAFNKNLQAPPFCLIIF